MHISIQTLDIVQLTTTHRRLIAVGHRAGSRWQVLVSRKSHEHALSQLETIKPEKDRFIGFESLRPWLSTIVDHVVRRRDARWRTECRPNVNNVTECTVRTSERRPLEDLWLRNCVITNSRDSRSRIVNNSHGQPSSQFGGRRKSWTEFIRDTDNEVSEQFDFPDSIRKSAHCSIHFCPAALRPAIWSDTHRTVELFSWVRQTSWSPRLTDLKAARFTNFFICERSPVDVRAPAKNFAWRTSRGEPDNEESSAKITDPKVWKFAALLSAC